MKYVLTFFIILSTILLLSSFVQQSWQVPENPIQDAMPQFPESIKIGEKAKFSLKMSNPKDYRISDIVSIVEIMPKSVSEFVHIEINPQISTIWEGFYEITYGTILVDKGIPVDRIFVSVSFVGKNQDEEQVSLKIISSNSASIKIEKGSAQSGKSIFEYKDKVKYTLNASKPSDSDIHYYIQGGTVETIAILSDGSLQIDVSMKQDGILSLDIPKKTWFLADGSCNPVESFVLVDGKEYSFLGELDGDSEQYGYSERLASWGRTVDLRLPASAKSIQFAVIDLLVGNIPNAWQLGQKCLALPKADSPLQQFKSGISVNQIKCNEGLVLLLHPIIETPACVKAKTEQKLVQRGWYYPVPLGWPTGGILEYEKTLPTYSELDVTRISFENCCAENMICYGNFDNGTTVRISCDGIVLHSCDVGSFDNYTLVENEN